jgi:hypothetical protein
VFSGAESIVSLNYRKAGGEIETLVVEQPRSATAATLEMLRRFANTSQ